MTPELSNSKFLHRAPSGAARLEWIQLWSGVDRETEWFDIPESGIAVEGSGGLRFTANQSQVGAESASEEVRVRAVLRVDHPDGCRVQLRGVLRDGSQVVLRDAFGFEVLQATEGTPRLLLDLSLGRFAVDAVLTPRSSISVEVLRATARRSRGRASNAG